MRGYEMTMNSQSWNEMEKNFLVCEEIENWNISARSSLDSFFLLLKLHLRFVFILWREE
jgi:hypothetical protein